MLVAERLFSELGQVPRHGDDVADLASVDLDPRQLGQVHLQVLHVDAVLGAREHPHKVAPDLEPVLFIKCWVIQGQLDA